MSACDVPVNSISVPRPTRVVIIGGGFSGALTAANIARFSDTAVHVTVINRDATVGRGVAYAQRRPEYLLNVAARNMSAFPDRPDHFVHWLRARAEFDSVSDTELRERFIARQIYGEYLSSLVQQYLVEPVESSSVTTEFIVGDAVDIDVRGDASVVHLADGATLQADRVILATGNEPPAPLPGAERLSEHPGWVGNPWQAWEKNLPDGDADLVILGTGLTAVDAIVTLRTLGWGGSIHAVSRHGWFPHGHFRGVVYDDFPPADVDLGELGLDRLLALVQKHCAILHDHNVNAAIIVDKLRPYTQPIWTHFSRDERLDFAKHHAALWNVYRHRIAPELHSEITNAQLAGQLHVHPGNIRQLEAAGEQILVHLDGREPLVGDLVLNATGPATRFTATRSVLLQNLLRRGLVAPDDIDMGVRVDPDHTVVDGSGERVPWLLALGPLLRGTYWETIAVPELRGQARRVAETALDRVRTDEEALELALLEHMI